MFASNNLPICADSPSLTSIKVTSEATERPAPILAFQDAGLHPVMLSNVEKSGYSIPTPIQAYTIPAVLKGKDIIATAQTGKTKDTLHCFFTDKYRIWKDSRLPYPLFIETDGQGQETGSTTTRSGQWL